MSRPSEQRARLSTIGAGLGSNSDTVRQSNLSAVLGLVHSLGAISRAQLTRALGLNRSTVALLVAELVQLGLVVESNADPTNRIGRPSALVEPSRRTVALAINPDLHAIRIAVVSLGGHVLEAVTYDTVRVPSVREVVNVATVVLASMKSHLDSGYQVIGAGVAVPGLVRTADGSVIDAPHLGWRDEPLCSMLTEAIGVPAFAANDAAVGASAQATFGDGREVRDFVYLYGGASGIGGGLVIDGSRVSGASGFAGQLGHTHVRTGGAQCACGSRGCLEAEVTRHELGDAVGVDASDGSVLERAILDRLESENGEGEITAIVDRQAGLLAVALASVSSLINPRRILLDGFLRILFLADPDRMTRSVHGSAGSGPRSEVEIGLASLDSDPLLVGAAQLAFAGLIRDPAGRSLPEPRPVGDALIREV